MRRGLVQVDWVISFGIFVTFLLLMFIWFGPALTGEYDDSYLKDVAEKGFKEAAFAEVWEYPVFVELSPSFPNGESLGLGVKLPRELQGKPIEQLSVVNNTGARSYLVTDRKLDGNKLYFKRDVLSNLVNYSVRIIYSDGFNVSWNPVANPVGHEDKYNTTIGVKNVIRGFSENKFNNLSSLDYKEFKEALKYPASKDISVFIYDGPSMLTQLYNYSQALPTEEDNVYVVRWTDYLVDEYGRYDSIIILIKTW